MSIKRISALSATAIGMNELVKMLNEHDAVYILKGEVVVATLQPLFNLRKDKGQ